MMVLREISVECPAKIAMTALRSRSGTMRLLPDHDLSRRHFSWGKLFNLEMCSRTRVASHGRDAELIRFMD
jgi:hypothetical protein